MAKISGTAPQDIALLNPTHHAWRRLLKSGFPFVKTDLLRDGVAGIDTADWQDVCRAHGADVEAMQRHIEGSRLNRLRFKFDRTKLNGED